LHVPIQIKCACFRGLLMLARIVFLQNYLPQSLFIVSVTKSDIRCLHTNFLVKDKKENDRSRMGDFYEMFFEDADL